MKDENKERVVRMKGIRTFQNVVTLALGSRPRQGLTRLQAKSEAQESHRMLPGV